MATPPPDWDGEQAVRLRRGLQQVAFIAAFFLVAFAGVDWVVYSRELAGAFLPVRLGAAAAYVVPLALLPRLKSTRALTVVGVAEVWLIASVICFMLLHTGYEASLYWAGLIVTLVGMGVALPWAWQATVVAGLGVVAMYGAVAAVASNRDLSTALNNGAFLLATVIISAAANRSGMQLRQAEFAGRRSLAAAFDDLKDMDRLKSNFMANLSHEMRTPLTLMLGSFEALTLSAGEGMGPRVREGLDTARRNGLTLLRLINDQLDLARVDASLERLRLEEYDLVEQVAGIASQVRPMMDWRGVSLELDLPPAPVLITLDPAKVEKVTMNLLSNAFKFTPAGGRIRISLLPRQDAVEVAVGDTGIGIPDEDQVRIFERFRQVESGPTRSRGGTGIGLSLVQEYVNLHNGTVTVQSTVGVGSVFTVRWPRDVSAIPEDRIDRRMVNAEPAARRRADDHSLSAWSQQLTESADYRYGDFYQVAEGEVADASPNGTGAGLVLVVEDSADLRRFVTTQLATTYRVVAARDGLEGWERAREHRPDVIVTDLMMPRRDGHWLCEQLHEHEETRQIPVVMLTASGQDADRVKARQKGADIYLTKPFSVRELLAAVGSLMARKQERVDALSQETASSLRTLIGGVAHEVLNPLGFMSSSVSAIQGILDGLARRPPDGSAEAQEHLLKQLATCRRLVEAAQVGSKRIRALVDELGAMAHASAAAEPDWVDLNHQLRATLLLTGLEDHPTLGVHLDLCEDATVLCRVARLNQGLLTLVRNAIQAVDPERGHIWVKTAWDGDALRITVADDGCGIAPEQLDRVFDPFFTTRDPGKGMGLGLALCRQVVEEHAGNVKLRSARGQGTTVVVTLPRGGTRQATAVAVSA